MAVTLKASTQGLYIVEGARKKKGWGALDFSWCDAALVSKSTLKRFREGKPVLQDSFINICKAVGIDNWEFILDESFNQLPDRSTQSNWSGEYLQTKFLEELIQQIFPKRSASEFQQECFRFRFHPDNWHLNNQQIGKQVRKKLTTKPSITFEKALSEAIEKLKQVFAPEIKADAVEIQKSKSKSSEEKKASWQMIYNWLWENKFSREGWLLAQKIATSATKQLRMIYYSEDKIDPARDLLLDNDPDRDLFLDEIEIPQQIIQQGQQYRLKIDLQQEGYLLLIDQSVSDQKYCICPSRLYTLNRQFSTNQSIYLPYEYGEIKCFRFNNIGEEYFLAIVTKYPLNLPWVRSDYSPDSIIDYVKIDEERLQEIFRQIGKQSDSQVFYTKFKIENAKRADVIRAETIAKIRQLPDSLIKEVNDFVDSLLMKRDNKRR